MDPKFQDQVVRVNQLHAEGLDKYARAEILSLESPNTDEKVVLELMQAEREQFKSLIGFLKSAENMPLKNDYQVWSREISRPEKLKILKKRRRLRGIEEFGIGATIIPKSENICSSFLRNIIRKLNIH